MKTEMRWISLYFACHLVLFGEPVVQKLSSSISVNGLRYMNVVSMNRLNRQSILYSMRGGDDNKNMKGSKPNTSIYDRARRGGAINAPLSKRTPSNDFPNSFSEVMDKFQQIEERARNNGYGWGNYMKRRKQTQLNVVVNSVVSEPTQQNKNKQTLIEVPARLRTISLMSINELEDFIKNDKDEEENNLPRKTVVDTTRINVQQKKNQKKHKIQTLDFAVFATYICSMFCLTAPVVLIPVISGDASMLVPSSSLFSSVTSSSFAASVASISVLGAGFGKLLNGFVCQTLGSRRSLTLYLSGLSIFAFLFSRAQNIEQLTLAVTGMEFFSSIMWTACAVVFATHYEKDDQKFTSSISFLSLSSTIASLMAKVGFSFLLTIMDWRSLATFSAFIAGSGVLVVNQFVTDSVEKKVKPEVEGLSLESVGESVEQVTNNSLFWKVGIAHAVMFLVRTSDKVMGGFFQEATNLPRSACGGLTSFMTIGFAIGAILSSRKFNSLPHPKEKKNFVRGLNLIAAASAIALSVCANPSTQSFLAASGLPLLPLTLVLASGLMACSVSFQFYTFPAKFAASFGKYKAVCLSFIDGLGFFVCALIWNLSSRIVGENGMFGQFEGVGWMVTWGFLAASLVWGGEFMQPLLSQIFDWKKDLGEKQNDRSLTNRLKK